MRKLPLIAALGVWLTASLAGAQVITVLPAATGGDPVGDWAADSTNYQVYVPPEASAFSLSFAGKLNGRFTVRRDSSYTARYVVMVKASVNFLGLRTFDLSDTSNASGRYSIRGTSMVVTGLDSVGSVDTLSYSVNRDTLTLMLPVTDPRVTVFGIRLIVVLPFRRLPAPAGISADFDGNGKVDFDDFFIFAEGFGKRRGDAGYSARIDLNSDGSVDFDDFFLFAERFGGSG